MRNLEASPWFVEPNLLNVKALESGAQANTFTLTVKQGSPRGEDGKEEGKP